MNTQANAMHEPLQSVAPAAIPASRVFYCSVRRELWENRFVYVAPLAIGAVAVLAFSMSSIAGIWEKALRLDATRHGVATPYDLAAGLMMLTSILVSVFYCLD